MRGVRAASSCSTVTRKPLVLVRGDDDRHAAGEGDRLGVRRPVGSRADDLVAGVAEHGERGEHGVLAAVGDQHVGRPAVEPGVPLGLDRDGLPQLRQPAGGGVAVVLLVPAGGDRRLHDVLRGREVRLAGAEADDVLARRLEGLGLGVDGQRGRLGDGPDPSGDAGLEMAVTVPHAGTVTSAPSPPDPRRAAAARRPLRLRSVEGPSRGHGGAGCGRPEPGWGRPTGRHRCATSSARCAPGCASCSASPTAGRSCSATAARPRSGTSPPSG